MKDNTRRVIRPRSRRTPVKRPRKKLPPKGKIWINPPSRNKRPLPVKRPRARRPSPEDLARMNPVLGPDDRVHTLPVVRKPRTGLPVKRPRVPRRINPHKKPLTKSQLLQLKKRIRIIREMKKYKKRNTKREPRPIPIDAERRLKQNKPKSIRLPPRDIKVKKKINNQKREPKARLLRK